MFNLAERGPIASAPLGLIDIDNQIWKYAYAQFIVESCNQGATRMGWRGTVRSLNAALKSAERESQRRSKAQLKQEIAEHAETAVSEWQAYLLELKTVHVRLANAVDWNSLAEKTQPDKPGRLTKHIDKANKALKKFKPGRLDFLRGGTEKRQQKLLDAQQAAPDIDQADYEKAIKKYSEEFAEWETDTTLARKLIAGDPEAVKEVIDECQSMSGEHLIGESIQFEISEFAVHAKPNIHTTEIVPDYRLKQLASGKLSNTKMPIGQRNEIYQDYVASVALKVAGDLFKILPHQEVYVTCIAEMLNSATGHKEPTPILTTHFVRETYFDLNLVSVDPSDSLTNFRHDMDFRKTKGFRAINSSLVPS